MSIDKDVRNTDKPCKNNDGTTLIFTGQKKSDYQDTARPRKQLG
jgi:hypothetical protein